MSQIPGFLELEAAKTLLLTALAAGIDEDQVVPGLQRLEAFRNSLCQADHLFIAAAEQHGLPERHAVSTVEKLVAQALRISYADAKRRVRAATACGPRTTMLGDQLEPVRPAVAEGQATGELSPVAVDAIVRTLEKVELFAPAEVESTEQILAGYGAAFDHQELSKVCDRILDHLDPDGTKPRDAIQAERRELFLSRCRDGMIRVDGRLTPAAGARIKAVLGPLAAPRHSIEAGPDGAERLVPDLRTSQQRMHDALDEASARLLRAGDVPGTGGTPATVIITIRDDQLPIPSNAQQPRTDTPADGGSDTSESGTGEKSQTRSREPFDKPRERSAEPRVRSGRIDEAGGGFGAASWVTAGTTTATAETSTGEVLSVAEALRVAAEAEIIGVVLTGAGRPLHLGRSRRLATSSQTYALIARDGGCSFPGCTAPPEWCERHHILAWSLGGTTDIDNLTLLCGYHHAHFVQTGWTCRITPDGLPEWLPPHWQDRQRRPLINHRIRDRHRLVC